MKTVKQWAEQLPELIKASLFANKKLKIDNQASSLYGAIRTAFIWEDDKLGHDFWEGVKENAAEIEFSADYLDESVPYTKEEVEGMIIQYADQNDDVCKIMLANVLTNAYFPEIEIMHAPQNIEDNFKASHDNQTTVDYDFAWKGANEPKQKKSSIYSKVINTLKAENEALLQSNTEFKKLHKTLLEKVKTQGDLIFKQQNEKQALKFEMSFLEDKVIAQEETIKTLTQMVIPAPKKKQSIFFDLLEHLNIIKK